MALSISQLSTLFIVASAYLAVDISILGEGVVSLPVALNRTSFSFCRQLHLFLSPLYGFVTDSGLAVIGDAGGF